MVVDVVVQNPQKVTSTNMRKNIYYAVTPTCAAAVVSAVVLRRPTKEYTHPYSMMHRRLPTAGNEVAPHYHQLLVRYEYSLYVLRLSLIHISEPTRLGMISYAVFCLKKKNVRRHSKMCCCCCCCCFCCGAPTTDERIHAPVFHDA